MAKDSVHSFNKGSKVAERSLHFGKTIEGALMIVVTAAQRRRLQGAVEPGVSRLRRASATDTASPAQVARRRESRSRAD